MNSRAMFEQMLGRRLSDDDWHDIEAEYGADMNAGAERWMIEATGFALALVGIGRRSKGLEDRPDSTTTTARVHGESETAQLDARSAALTALALAMAKDDLRVKRWRSTHRPNGEPRPPESLSTEEVGELAVLGEQLAERYGWDMQEAQAFVALDYVPPVRPIAGTVTVSSATQRLPDSHALGGSLIPLPWLNRITLSVDPAVTPDQLADHWKDLRRRCVLGTHRPQRQRSLDLVAFIADRTADESAGRAMKAWNAAHPEATYTHSYHLVRDAREALSKLLYQELTLPAEGSSPGSSTPSEPSDAMG